MPKAKNAGPVEAEDTRTVKEKELTAENAILRKKIDELNSYILKWLSK